MVYDEWLLYYRPKHGVDSITQSLNYKEITDNFQKMLRADRRYRKWFKAEKDNFLYTKLPHSKKARKKHDRKMAWIRSRAEKALALPVTEVLEKWNSPVLESFFREYPEARSWTMKQMYEELDPKRHFKGHSEGHIFNKVINTGVLRSGLSGIYLKDDFLGLSKGTGNPLTKGAVWAAVNWDMLTMEAAKDFFYNEIPAEIREEVIKAIPNTIERNNSIWKAYLEFTQGNIDAKLGLKTNPYIFRTEMPQLRMMNYLTNRSGKTQKKVEFSDISDMMFPKWNSFYSDQKEKYLSLIENPHKRHDIGMFSYDEISKFTIQENIRDYQRQFIMENSEGKYKWRRSKYEKLLEISDDELKKEATKISRSRGFNRTKLSHKLEARIEDSREIGRRIMPEDGNSVFSNEELIHILGVLKYPDTRDPNKIAEVKNIIHTLNERSKNEEKIPELENPLEKYDCTFILKGMGYQPEKLNRKLTTYRKHEKEDFNKEFVPHPDIPQDKIDDFLGDSSIFDDFDNDISNRLDLAVYDLDKVEAYDNTLMYNDFLSSSAQSLEKQGYSTEVTSDPPELERDFLTLADKKKKANVDELTPDLPGMDLNIESRQMETGNTVENPSQFQPTMQPQMQTEPQMSQPTNPQMDPQMPQQFQPGLSDLDMEDDSDDYNLSYDDEDWNDEEEDGIGVMSIEEMAKQSEGSYRRASNDVPPTSENDLVIDWDDDYGNDEDYRLYYDEEGEGENTYDDSFHAVNDHQPLDNGKGIAETNVEQPGPSTGMTMDDTIAQVPQMQQVDPDVEMGANPEDNSVQQEKTKKTSKEKTKEKKPKEASVKIPVIFNQKKYEENGTIELVYDKQHRDCKIKLDVRNLRTPDLIFERMTTINEYLKKGNYPSFETNVTMDKSSGAVVFKADIDSVIKNMEKTMAHNKEAENKTSKKGDSPKLRE